MTVISASTEGVHNKYDYTSIYFGGQIGYLPKKSIQIPVQVKLANLYTCHIAPHLMFAVTPVLRIGNAFAHAARATCYPQNICFPGPCQYPSVHHMSDELTSLQVKAFQATQKFTCVHHGNQTQDLNSTGDALYH